jgi:GTP-binding protein Era
MLELNEKYKNFRAGYITIIGRPNSGKSTLMNSLLREKISIVTEKPQTTRQNVLGILSDEGYQMVFTDTPGLLTPKYKLQEAMLNSAVRAIKEADLIFYLVEADGNLKEKDVAVFKQLELDPKQVFLLINKIDLTEKGALLPLIQFYHTTLQPSEIFPISALNQVGLPELVQSVIARLPLNPPFFPEDELSTFPERFFVAEIIREKIFLNFEQEIPYSTTVHIEEFKERENGKDYIRAAIYIERAAQRKILIGKNGSALKKIGQLARTEIEAFLQRPVFLELYVGVREKWRQNERLLKEFGYLS